MAHLAQTGIFGWLVCGLGGLAERGQEYSQEYTHIVNDMAMAPNLTVLFSPFFGDFL